MNNSREQVQRLRLKAWEAGVGGGRTVKILSLSALIRRYYTHRVYHLLFFFLYSVGGRLIIPFRRISLPAGFTQWICPSA